MSAAVISPIAEPFPGLRPFRAADSTYFFGRDEQIEGLLSRLATSRFLAVVGTSGSGKSSLVSAGLIPTIGQGHLGRTGSTWAVANILHPGADPIAGLANSLAETFSGKGLPPAEIEDGLLKNSAGLSDFARRHLDPNQHLLVFVDQFEELFRYRQRAGAVGRERSTAFVKLLLVATGNSEVVLSPSEPSRIYVALTMRSDYLGRCAQFRSLPEALNDVQYLVPRLTRDQLRETIEGPTALAGATIADELVDRLLNDTADNPDMLPLLQHALSRLWEESADDRARGKEISLAHYQAVGEISDALNRDAEWAFAQLKDARREAVARQVFRHLVEAGAEDEETRRPAPMSELVHICGEPGEVIRDVLELFRKRGFIAYSGDRDPVVDISHESFIRQWESLRKWVQEEAVDRKDFEQFATFAATGLPRKDWLRGGQLDRAEEWLNKGLTENWAGQYRGNYKQTVEFIHGSLQQRRWERRRAWYVAAASAIVALLVAILALLAYNARREAGHANEKLAESNQRLENANAQIVTEARETARVNTQLSDANKQLSDTNSKLKVTLEGERQARSETALQRLLGVWQLAARQAARDAADHSDDDRTALLAREALLIHGVTPNQPRYLVEDALQSAARLVVFSHVLSGHQGAVPSVAFSPDGTRLASASFDQTVRLWDLRQPQAAPQILSGHQGTVFSVAFSPDGTRLASASADKTVRLWDLRQPQAAPQILSGYQGTVFSVAFSPDGTRLASASADKTVRLWDLRQPQPAPQVLSGDQGRVYSVAFSHDGTRLASGSDDRTVRLWDLRQPQAAPEVLSGHQGAVLSVAFSPDGTRLASASADETVRLWDLRQPEAEPHVLSGHQDYVYSVAFSPDGARLASAADDGTVRLWDPRQPEAEPQVLYGHRDVVLSVAFSPDDTRLASASGDRTVRLWDLRQPQAAPQVLSGRDLVYSVAFSADGTHLASASSWTVQLRDLRQPQAAPQDRSGHQGAVLSVAFSPDGARLASASEDRTVRLWDLHQPQAAPQVLSGHQDAVISVAFSPDGTRLASASADKTVRLWDLRQPQVAPQVLSGHQDAVRSVVFSPDGTRLASASDDRTVRLWDLHQLRVAPQVLSGHQGTVYSVAFSPDGTRLASASDDHTVRLWDLRQPQVAPQVLSGHQDAVRSVAFSPDGTRLASASRDQTVHLWSIWTAAADYLCTRVWRNLSMEEWRLYIGEGIPYERTCPNLPPGADAPK